MYGSEFFNSSLWWICPVLMIVICFFVMRGRRGSIMCGLGSHKKDRHHMSTSDSATDILDKRYASGEIDKEEYEEKKMETKDHGTKEKGTGFGYCNPENFKEMFEKMSKFCPGQGDSSDFSAMKGAMMKNMMEMCCKPIATDTKGDADNQNE